MRAIVLAGGKGTRLRPFTTLIPKPLVPIGDEMSILEIILRQLSKNGFDHVTVAVSHLANLIMAFFGDGARWGIKIDYSMEEKPLSTIGPLTLIDDLPENFLVMNGDILCDLNYREFYDCHVAERNLVSVSMYRREAKIDFGVITCDEEGRIAGFVEKPTFRFDVSMGIYCLNRSVIENLPKGEKYGFDDLMLDGIAANKGYRAKVFNGLWLDIGRPEDYDYCNEHYQEIKAKIGE